MGLKIIKANEPIKVERLIICIYALPGVGKTTLGAMADKPLTLDFDKGVHRAALRKDSVVIDKWSDIDDLDEEALKEYNTIVVDTVGRALDVLSIDIIEKNSKHGRGSGALSLQGYGELKARFTDWLKLLKSFGKDVILLSHKDEQRNGDDVIDRLDIQGGSKNEIYKVSDAMGRIVVDKKGNYLDFNPSAESLGKNPAQLPHVKIPNATANPNFTGELISSIKEKLNEQTEEQRKAQQDLEEWRNFVNGLETLDDINSSLETVRGVPMPMRQIFFTHATSKGFEYNKETNLYQQKEEATA